MSTEPSSTDANLRTIQVIYHGHVQGVGFRVSTADIASRFPVVGYVQNLSNGTVELVARGSPETVQSFLDAINFRFANKIAKSVVSPVTIDEEFEEFQIRH